MRSAPCGPYGTRASPSGNLTTSSQANRRATTKSTFVVHEKTRKYMDYSRITLCEGEICYNLQYESPAGTGSKMGLLVNFSAYPKADVEQWVN